MIVDVIVVNSVMGLKGWERGEGGQNRGVGQLLLGRGPELMRIHHHEQNIGLQVSWGSFLLFQKGVLLDD